MDALTNPAPRRLQRAGAIVLAAMAVIAIVYLRWQGRVWWCEQGDFWPISIQVKSPHNSQHVFDAYSLSHLLHGVLFCGFFWLFRNRMSVSWRMVAATAVEIGWEMLENSPIIIERYRSTTTSKWYTGDSIINSVGDTISFLAGYVIARRVGWRWSIVIFIVVELAMLWIMRDNLTLNVLMLLWPIDAIRRWQSGG